MKRIFLTLLTGLSLSQSAFADCWMQCINSPFGGCMGKVKMCNVTDSGNAFESLSSDLKAAYDNIKGEWSQIYGRLPDELRVVLDTYPITVVALLTPGTREYVLFAAALDGFVHKSKARGQDIKPFIESGVEWKKKSATDGFRLLFALESIDVGSTDWSDPADAPIPDIYDNVWAKFLDCLNRAEDASGGKQCVSDLKIAALPLSA